MQNGPQFYMIYKKCKLKQRDIFTSDQNALKNEQNIYTVVVPGIIR